MNRRYGIALLPSLSALVMVGALGCAKPTVVGKWQGTMNVQGRSVQANFDLKPDGTMSQTMPTPLGEVAVAGTYKAENDTLTMTGTNVTMNGKPLPAQIASLIPKDQLSTTATYQLNGDTLTLTRNGQTYTLNRVKEDAAK